MKAGSSLYWTYCMRIQEEHLDGGWRGHHLGDVRFDSFDYVHY
jgi:hypothetical protein